MSAGERLPGTPQPRHVWTGHGGIRLAADSWGNPDGAPVILMHGGGQTRHSWRGAGQRLGASGYHAIAFDARGHGDSGWAEKDGYGVDRMVADLRCVIGELGTVPPVLVGASMGGATALVAVGERRVEARALVMVDIAPRIEADGRARIRDFMDQKPEGFDSLKEVAEAIARYQPHRKRPRTLDGLAKNVRLAANGKYVWHWDPARRLSQVGDPGYRQRLSDAADSLDLPVLLVRGGMSDVLSEEGARAFLEQVPHAEYARVGNAAHMVAGDRNDLFAQSVIRFLLRVVPPTG